MNDASKNLDVRLNKLFLDIHKTNPNEALPRLLGYIQGYIVDNALIDPVAQEHLVANIERIIKISAYKEVDISTL